MIRIKIVAVNTLEQHGAAIHQKLLAFDLDAFKADPNAFTGKHLITLAQRKH